MELMISLIIGILIVEGYAWLPKISRWLVERAVQQVRSEDQIRCREEWNAGLDALPNTIAKLVHAISYLGAAHRINTDFFETKLTEVDDVIGELGRKHLGMVVYFRAAKENLGKQKKETRRLLDRHLADMKSQMVEISNKKPTLSFQNFMRSVERWLSTYINATDQAVELLVGSIDCSITRLDHVQELLAAALKKRKHVSDMLVSRDVPPDSLTALLTNLAGDLHAIEGIFEDDKWGDDDALLKHKRLVTALENASLKSSALLKSRSAEKQSGMEK